MSSVKAFTPQIKAAGDDGTVSFVVARLNDHVDEDGDLTLSGYFGRQTVVMVPAHNWEHVPIGKGQLYEVGNDAIVDVKFNMAIEAARDWHASIKFDFENPPALQEYSYAYTVKDGGSKRGEFNGRDVRILQPLADGSPGADIHEVSPVLLGAAGRGMSRTLAAKHRNSDDAARDALTRQFVQLVATAHGIELPKSIDEQVRAEHLRFIRNQFELG